MILIQKLHQVVVIEVSLLVVVKVDQERLDYFINGDLGDLFRLDFAQQVGEYPMHRLKAINKDDRVHHLNLFRSSLITLDRLLSFGSRDRNSWFAFLI